MADTAAEKPVKVELLKVHPEIPEHHARMSALIVDLHEARRSAAPAPAGAAGEVARLLAWAEAVAAEATGDVEAFRAKTRRDRAAFATALKLSGDELIVRQLLDACEDLRVLGAPRS